MRYLLAGLLSLLGYTTFSQIEPDTLPDYPIAAKKPYYIVNHGDSLYQPYYWMRTKNAPEVVNYLYEENSYSDQQMKSTAILQKKLFEEMRSTYDENYVSRPGRRDNYYYYSRSVAGEEQALYCRKKDSLTAPEEVYFNPNKPLKEFGVPQLAGMDISEDHQFMVLTLAQGGSGYGTVVVRVIATDSLLADRILDATSVSVLPDDKTILYQKNAPGSKWPNLLYRHTIGTDTTADVLVYQSNNLRSSLSYYVSESKRFLFIVQSFLGSSGDIYVIDLNSGNWTPRKIYTGKTGVEVNYTHREGNYFTVFTNKNAPDYKVVQVEIDDLTNERMLYAEEPGAKLITFDVKGDYWIVGKMRNGLNELKIVNSITQKTVRLKGPDANGVIGYSSRLKYDSTGIEYYFTSMVSPSVIYRYDLEKDTSVLVWQDTIRGYDAGQYKTERIWATARDGVKVPIDILYDKDMKRDGSNPLYLTGYACYGSNIDPSFSEMALPYLKRGFVYAIAHPRGESILGQQWHDDGKMMKKQNTFNDFVDCTLHLIDSAYTSKKKIVAQGGSAGGLLMGAIANDRPDLYGAIIADVPFTNALEEMLDTSISNIPYHFTEIGNPFRPDHYFYIKSYSPYHNIKKQDYPAMLITASFNDENVAYWSPVQYAAQLRAMKTDTNLLLLKTNMNAGHSGSYGRYSSLKDQAFSLAFAMKSLGIKEEYFTVSGKVYDSQGEALPYANVFIPGTSNGTVTNFEGAFSLDIREGQKFEIVVQSVGFKKKVYAIDTKTQVKDIEIHLETENFELQEVKIVNESRRSRGHDIIRKANERKGFYDRQLDNYSVNVYMKEVERLDSIPKKLPAFLKKADIPDSNDLGLMYLSEAINKYSYHRPDDYKEQMLSSRVAGRKQGLSWTRVSQVDLNFYKNSLIVEGEKPFISPIADGGIMLYKYDLEGSFIEDNHFVYKVKVTPRNRAEAVFEGYIYINDESWSIHSVDLYITKKQGIEFADSIYIRQTYGFVSDSISAPRSVSLNERYTIFGFTAGFMSVGAFYDYRFHQQFPKKFFQKQVFSIAEDAMKKDSTFWQENRPVVLTDEEDSYYVKRDSDTIPKKIYNDAESDSLRRRGNRMTLDELFLLGYRYRTKNAYTWSLGPLADGLGYNTVEGAKAELRVGISKNKSKSGDWFDMNSWSVFTRWRYGFSSTKLYGRLIFSRTNFGEQKYWDVSVGTSVHQYNGFEPINDMVNAGYSLILRQNFMKIYDKTGIQFSYVDQLKTGPHLRFQAEYSQRHALQNHENWYISKKVKDQTTSNNPLNPLSDSLAFQTHEALILKFSGKYTPGEKYEMMYNFRRVIGSKYPTFYWQFEQAVNVAGSDIGYGRYEIGVGKSINLAYWGKANLDVIAGGFVNKNALYFMDYKHFNGNQTHILKNGGYNWGGRGQLDQYNALDYYSFSTNDNYVEIHYQHRFLGLFLTKIPLLNKLHLQEVAGINGAYTSGGRNYQELYVGVENMFKVFRVDFVATYQTHQAIKPVIRIGIKMPI